MYAKFEFCDNLIEIQNFKHSIEDEMSGNPYNCSFNIKIISGSFSGLADACECDYKELKQFISQLNNLLNFKACDVIFQEIGYGGTLRFSGDKLGHIKVSGLIYGNSMTHSLQFEFTADQTALPEFIKQLESL